MEFLASAAFGFEGLVKRDLQRLGAEDAKPLPSGGVSFSGDMAMGFRANMWLRTADRILLVMSRFQALSFEDLFQGVRRIEWESILPADADVPVKAHCARSRLMSPSDCQSIVKKAIVERMKAAYDIDWLAQTGQKHEVDVSIHEDTVTISLNTSGTALNRRGYRTFNALAPMRETMAAAMALWSPWRNKLALYDPCCGSGTILIEAAYIALDRAPGLTREFDMELWPKAPIDEMRAIRLDAQKRFETGKTRPVSISGSDVDPEVIQLARRHISQAGLDGLIQVSVADIKDVRVSGEGVFLVNPPYGERLGDLKSARGVAGAVGDMLMRSKGWGMSVMTADPGFELAMGYRADRRRRLYNGRLECEMLTYDISARRIEAKASSPSFDREKRTHRPGKDGSRK
ncbi:MAG: class I SAM-dependent RNA methyltransferase [Clostridia bacterium]|nr:class I SAM-dependent RNA methyltransferase [Clostridia bacterium]